MLHFEQRIKDLLSTHPPSPTELLDCLLLQGAHLSASDIHIDPSEKFVTVRYRIDGLLQKGIDLPKNIQAPLIARIKVMAGLRLDEHYLPKDGAFRVAPEKGFGSSLDIRVSLMPTYYGENAVLRLLAINANELSLEKIGFDSDERTAITKTLGCAEGLIISSGPTGSGKTTTLYALLNILNKDNACIITLEDPIEYVLPGIRQIQVNGKSGLTFANGLRSILRQDPDIIMIGEIRDDETASLGVTAALTGHLVLSTLHTRNASAVWFRLIDMGVPSYLLASTLRLIINQRLIRKISRESENAFHGRTILAELLHIDETMSSFLMRSRSRKDIETEAIKRGMVSILDRGKQRVEKGLTTIQEIMRVIRAEI